MAARSGQARKNVRGAGGRALKQAKGAVARDAEQPAVVGRKDQLRSLHHAQTRPESATRSAWPRLAGWTWTYLRHGERVRGKLARWGPGCGRPQPDDGVLRFGRLAMRVFTHPPTVSMCDEGAAGGTSPTLQAEAATVPAWLTASATISDGWPYLPRSIPRLLSSDS